MQCSPRVETMIHHFLTTSPFLLLFSYFIVSANRRPNLPIYHLDEINDDELRQEIEKYGMPAIALGDMLISFLLTLMLLVILMVYLQFFNGRRHELMERYKIGETGGVISVLGNVLYNRPLGCCATLRGKNEDYAYVTYRYPYHTTKTEPMTEKLKSVSGTFNHDADDKYDDNTKLVVEKIVRTYHPYDRESINILLLPGLPLSGQPLADIDRDLSSYQSNYAEQNRSQMRYVLMQCGLWVVFCLIGALYILDQILIVRGIQIEEAYDVENLWLVEHVWSFFWVILVGVTPLLAVGGNVVRWWSYHRWVTNQGVVTAHTIKIVPMIESGGVL